MRYILLLVFGLLIGAGAAIFFLGVPSAKAIPGARVQASAPGGDPPATVVVSISDSFFEQLLTQSSEILVRLNSICRQTRQEDPIRCNQLLFRAAATTA